MLVYNSSLLPSIYDKNITTIQYSEFRKGLSTVDQLIKLEHQVKTGFGKKGKTAAVFLDVTRAYDECWREGVLHKIKRLGISGRICSYIENFMTERHFRVQVNNDLSERLIQQNGIPQG
jgi:hypothetical protein